LENEDEQGRESDVAFLPMDCGVMVACICHHST